MTATRIAVAGLMTAALTLTLTGCGGGGKPHGASATPELGAIDQLWQDASKGDDQSQDESNAQQMRVEELVAQCMAEQGFEYTPVDYSQMGGGKAIDPATDDDVPEWGTLEFAKQYGYGQTTNPYGDAVTDPATEGGDAWVDPNQAYTESMSETEIAAYQAALYGEQPNFTTDEEWENWNPTWEQQGCQGWAQHEVNPDLFGNTDPDKNKWADLEAEMTTMYESITSDPRLAKVTDEWVSCMADAGYPGLATIDDGQNQISEKVNTVYEKNDPWSELGPDATQEQYDAAQKQIDALLSDITDEEIATATADYTCRDKVDYQDTYNKVNTDLQKQFYDAHKADLEAYVAAMSGGVG